MWGVLSLLWYRLFAVAVDGSGVAGNGVEYWRRVCKEMADALASGRLPQDCARMVRQGSEHTRSSQQQ